MLNRLLKRLAEEIRARDKNRKDKKEKAERESSREELLKDATISELDSPKFREMDRTRRWHIVYDLTHNQH